MFGNSFFRSFNEDPFFSGYPQHMQRMDMMMNNMFDSDPFFGGMGRQQQIQDRPRGADRQNNQMMPFGDDVFQGFNSMFQNTRNMMNQMQQRLGNLQDDPNCHSFSQSSIMSFSNDGTGEPKMYQATTSTRRAPGGIKETRKSVRDSESGFNKLAVGHHINDRGHVIERSHNQRTGHREESQDFINIDEGEASQFDREWREKTERYQNRQAAVRDRDRRRQHHNARQAIADTSRHNDFRDRH